MMYAAAKFGLTETGICLLTIGANMNIGNLPRSSVIDNGLQKPE